MIIWWLFFLNDFDYLMIICSQLFVIMSFPHQQQVVRKPSFPKAFARHRGTSRDGCLSPWAYRSLRAAAEATHHHRPRSCLSCQYQPAERFAQLRPQRFSTRGSGPSRHAISDGNLQIPYLICESVRLVKRTLSWMPLSALSTKIVIAIIPIINTLAPHLLSVFCASEARKHPAATAPLLLWPLCRIHCA